MDINSHKVYKVFKSAFFCFAHYTVIMVTTLQTNYNRQYVCTTESTHRSIYRFPVRKEEFPKA